jgi:vacuolar-type H+-ATPase subunit D/Vma8
MKCKGLHSAWMNDIQPLTLHFQVIMKKIFLIWVILPGWLALSGQTGPSAMQRKVEELTSRISQLERENHHLIKEMRTRDSVAYCTLRLEIFEAFIRAPELCFDFKSTTDKIAITGLFAKLMQANNPTSDILGFRFSEIIFSACEKHLAKELKKEKDRTRFGLVITKIINNPIVSSLASTNPVTSVVAGIVSTIAGFSTTEAELKKDGARIKEVKVVNEDVFDEKSLAAFRNELQIYIDFYDVLILASDSYLTGLANLETKYSSLLESVRSYQQRLYASAGNQEKNIIIALSGLLPDPSDQVIDFQAYLVDEKILRTLLVAREYPVLNESVNELKKDYNSLLFHFLSEYIDALKSTGKFPAGVVDPIRIEALKEDINSFLESQKLTDDTPRPGTFSGNQIE